MKVFFLSFLIFLSACATAVKMNRLNVGMRRHDVISSMGQPTSTAAPGNGVEIYRYLLRPSWGSPVGSSEEYFVRMVNGVVESYGKVGDFDSTKDPTVNLNIDKK